eukprot:TRINITY_DN2820_c0_g1_i2.p2 TRINITY_DN2820_c0_g1~~TRINITY_DN2820_c0_g1_i2.p2  ORF type:complete len:164 (-),score=37.53 TRINITY_DN2820_c0_g1_i2:32-523(-)
MAVSSDTGTVHLFQVVIPPPEASQPQHATYTAGLTSYLPKQLAGLSEMWQNIRSVGQAKLQHAGVPSICAINSTKGQLYVLTATGFLSTFVLEGVLSGTAAKAVTYPLLSPGGAVGTLSPIAASAATPPAELSVSTPTAPLPQPQHPDSNANGVVTLSKSQVV